MVEEISPRQRTNFRTKKGPNWGRVISGLKNANAKRRVFWTQRTWTQALAPREVLKSQKTIAMFFLNASVLERKSLNRNLSLSAYHLSRNYYRGPLGLHNEFAENFLLPALLQKLIGEFFLMFRREIWKIKWEIWREFSGIFKISDPQNKGSKISGKISEHFS